jgi:hypothetical protein
MSDASDHGKPDHNKLHLERYLATTYDVEVRTPDGELTQFHLRDDVPSAVGLWSLELGVLQEQLQAAMEGDDFEVIDAAQAKWDRRIWYLFRALFRHTYPEIADDELRQLFRPLDQVTVVLGFIPRLSNSSTRVLPAGEPLEPVKTTTRTTRGASQTKRVVRSLS